jgi:hypothetical protein
LYGGSPLSHIRGTNAIEQNLGELTKFQWQIIRNDETTEDTEDTEEEKREMNNSDVNGFEISLPSEEFR